MSRGYTILPFALFSALLCGMTGCASTGLESLSVPELSLGKDEQEKEVPTRLIPVWTDTVLHRGGEAVRGFGGRVIFYGAEEEQPIEVDGVVMVYAWDDTHGRGQEAPDRKYVFKAATLSKHYSPSKVGHSYNFWLPWDPVGGETKHITLITRFISVAGGEVTSSAAHVVLPGPFEEGKKSKRRSKTTISKQTYDTTSGLAGTRQAVIQQLGFEQEIEPEPKDDTTTINLPMHLARGPAQDTGASATSKADMTASGSDFEFVVPDEAAAESAGDRQPISQPSGRFGRRQLPVRSQQSGSRFFSRERTERHPTTSQRGPSRSRQSAPESVQRKIARDAAEAKARREKEWGAYQSADRTKSDRQ